MFGLHILFIYFFKFGWNKKALRELFVKYRDLKNNSSKTVCNPTQVLLNLSKQERKL